MAGFSATLEVRGYARSPRLRSKSGCYARSRASRLRSKSAATPAAARIPSRVQIVSKSPLSLLSRETRDEFKEVNPFACTGCKLSLYKSLSCI